MKAETNTRKEKKRKGERQLATHHIQYHGFISDICDSNCPICANQIIPKEKKNSPNPLI